MLVLKTHSSSYWWATLSNAAVRSSTTSTIRLAGFFLEKPAAMLAVIIDSAVHVECFSRKPCWAGWKGMCVSIVGSRRYSSALAAGHSRLFGRQFVPMLLSLPGFLCLDYWDYRVVPYFRYLSSWDWQIEDVSEIDDGTMSEFLEVEGAHPVWSDSCGRLGQLDRFFVSADVKDGIPVNGSW